MISPGRAARVRFGLSVAAIVGGVGVLEWYAFTRGFRLNDRLPAVKLGAGPFVGTWHFRLTALIIPALAIAIAGVWFLPVIVERWRARHAIVLVSAMAAGFALVLAASDGWSAVIAPVTDTTEYWAGIAKARPAGDYLTTFLARQGGYSVHVRGHPPGFTLLLLLLRWADLGSAWAAAALSFIGVAMAVAAVGFTVWRIGGPEVFRRTLPFLAFA
ncbi:MAG: integral rane protein, partial [Ilumatobacteraceae bacterium]|nr:integral rane protein [Ilumatobacteraceae bacterium]